MSKNNGNNVISIQMQQDKVTKGAVRFSGNVAGRDTNIYLDKEAFKDAGGIPQSIKVDITLPKAA